MTDDTSDLEQLIVRNLKYKSPAPEKQSHASSPDPSRKRTRSRSRRKPRKPPSLPPSPPPSDITALRQNLAESAKHAQERALRIALVHSNNETNKKPAPRQNPSHGPIVIQAADKNEPPSRNRLRAPNEKKAEPSSVHADAAEIVDKYRREVGSLGSKALHKRDRKNYETAQLLKLGCRKPKSEKMPIGILVKKRKYQKIRERKKKEMDLATGMLVRSTRK